MQSSSRRCSVIKTTSLLQSAVQASPMAPQWRILAVAAMLLALCGPAQASDLSSLLQQASDIEDWLVQTRRTLHAFPELLFQVGWVAAPSLLPFRPWSSFPSHRKSRPLNPDA